MRTLLVNEMRQMKHEREREPGRERKRDNYRHAANGDGKTRRENVKQSKDELGSGQTISRKSSSLEP
jgi:hypothetical protein